MRHEHVAHTQAHKYVFAQLCAQHWMRCEAETLVVSHRSEHVPFSLHAVNESMCKNMAASGVTLCVHTPACTCDTFCSAAV